MILPKESLWAMHEGQLDGLQALLPGMVRNWPTAQQIVDAREASAKQLRRVSGSVAVLPLYGVVEQRLSGLGFLFGGVSTEQVGQALDALMAAKDVSAIVLDWDSPGGTISGVQELSDKIFNARGTKPIISVVDSMMASAAYWIGSAADQIAMTPGGDTGSVGVYSMHVDYSQALEAEGIKVTFIKAGKYKAEGNPYEPLSQETTDYVQQGVDEAYTAFVKAVARNRGVTASKVRADYGEGRVLGADAALAAGMVDRVATLEEVLGRLTGAGSGAAKAASVEVLRMRHEHAKAMEARRKSA